MSATLTSLGEWTVAQLQRLQRDTSLVGISTGVDPRVQAWCERHRSELRSLALVLCGDRLPIEHDDLVEQLEQSLREALKRLEAPLEQAS